MVEQYLLAKWTEWQVGGGSRSRQGGKSHINFVIEIDGILGLFLTLTIINIIERIIVINGNISLRSIGETTINVRPYLLDSASSTGSMTSPPEYTIHVYEHSASSLPCLLIQSEASNQSNISEQPFFSLLTTADDESIVDKGSIISQLGI